MLNSPLDILVYVLDLDEVDHLVDKKGGQENLYEFAGEADIVVTCLSLSAETVSHLPFPLVFAP